ncbi:MAG TPA: hypothetical protein PLT82_07265 [Candidatus Hydrogenedens sp.]|nr:hypothetical protein [Candidatus Hydrogenedens sp.]HOK09147.1 hypothetical protein [Candidatus Hydrogenedens sp.]HOL19259.1 hypothetical protein [Candidatus Hydrogenedens sp.]HPP58914.1 hypothetical protein [Candidatus Hydrogenedens sp.]
MEWERLKGKISNVVLLGVTYVALHSLLFLFYELFSLYLGLSGEGFPDSLILSVIDIIKEIILCAILAIIQSIIFSRLGVLLDFPVWRCKSDLEALRRFFLLWFGVNIALITITRVSVVLVDYGYSNLADLFSVLGIIANIIYLPLSICWMYSGEKLSEDDPMTRPFRAITRQFGETVGMWVIIAMSLFTSLFVLSLPVFEEQTILTALLKTVIIIPLAAVDIIVFCWTWLLCIQCRMQGLDEDYSLDEW